MKVSVSTPQNRSNSLSAPFSSRANRPTLSVLKPINTALDQLLTWLSGRTEIKISQALNSKAQIIWQVYDPSTDSTQVFCSEAEVRTWLEQRYR
jgi:hypothetical protein